MTYENLILDAERALYGVHDCTVAHCRFEGPADGESALKTAHDVTLTDCDFLLRYPLWHVDRLVLDDSRMEETCRAALWYVNEAVIRNCRLHGIKALRACSNVQLDGCDIVSQEFGWFCEGVKSHGTTLTGEYPFLHSRDLELEDFTLHGKYSFQYVENMVIRGADLDTKDAFWHSKHVTVYDSVIRGEYLAWYAEDLHLVRCKLIGTQPLCYCKGLVLEDCEMVDTDLAFECSEVQATVRGTVLSVKNPLSGSIVADGYGEVILDEQQPEGACCDIRTR